MKQYEGNVPQAQQMYFNWIMYGELIKFAMFSNIFTLQTMGGF